MTRQTASQIARSTRLGADLLKLVASGRTITESAKVLNVTRRVAQNALAKEHAYLLQSNEDLRVAVFAQELENLRLLRAAIMPRALAGEPRAVEVALQVGRDYRDMIGMTEAVKVDITVRKVDDAVEQIMGIVDRETGSVAPLRRLHSIEAG